MPADHRFKPSLVLSTFSTISLLFLTTSAHSAGFALIENSASGMGKAFAGAAAVAEDASTVWFNPAGMTYLAENLEGKSQLTNSAHIVSAKTDFTDKGSSMPALLGGGATSGDKNVSSRVTSLIPNLYYVRPINDRLQFGLAINGPFGSKTEYDDDWVGRYQATETDMKTLNINPSLAWKVNDKLSVGGGVSAQYITVKLGSSFDSTGACLKSATGPLKPGETDKRAMLGECVAAYPLASAGNVATDSKAAVEGDDVSFGFNLGLLYQPTKKTRIGASYRSKVKHELTGDATYDVDAPLKDITDSYNIKDYTNKAIKASVELPDSVSLSLVHKVNSRLELLGDVTWTRWSTFQELHVKDTAGNTVSNVDEKWKDVTRVSLGANYKYNDKLTLRTGVAYDQEPIPSARFRTPRIPGNDRTWISVGAGYKLNKKLALDFGYSHLFLKETPIDNPEGFSVRGLYDSHVDILSAQVNYTF